MKKVICFFLSLLLLLLSGCSDAQPTETMQARPTKALEFPGGVYAKAEDMRTLLVGLVEYDADGRTVITSLNVLVCGQDGRIDMLTIPKDTRVWVEYYENENFLYNTLDSIGSVYCAAESANLGPQKMVEAVSGLLGGISMDHYVLFNAVQLQNLTQLTGNIFLNVESTIPALGIEAGYQDITPMIAEYAEYTYLKSVNGVEYTGTDLYKLERHQNLVFALMKKMRNVLATLPNDADKESFAQKVSECVLCDLQPQDLLWWLGRDIVHFGDRVVLGGAHFEDEFSSFWSVDTAMLKEWIIRHFYPQAAEK